MKNSFDTNKYFNAAITRIFDEGWHEVVCDDNHGALLLRRDKDGRGSRLYIIEQFDFSERENGKPVRDFWIQIGDQCGWSDRDKAEYNRLMVAMFGADKAEGCGKVLAPHDLMGKKVRVLIRENKQTGVPEVVDFMTAK